MYPIEPRPEDAPYTETTTVIHETMPIPEPPGPASRPEYARPADVSAGAGAAGKLLPFSLGLLLCLAGVLIAWMVRRDDAEWKSGGAAASWIGCLLSPILWIVLILVGTVLFTLAAVPIGELLKHVWN